MKKLLYHIFYSILLICVGLGGLASLIYTIIQIPDTDKLSDSILFILCFIVFIAFSVFQTYSVIRSQKHEGVFLKGLLYGKEEVFATKTYIFNNFLLILGVFFVIYGSLLFIGLEIPFSGFPLPLDLLLISCGTLLIVNSIFIDLYPLVKEYDKEEKRVRPK